MEVVILTGASRGLGASLAAQLVDPARRLICVARHPNTALEEKARVMDAWLDYYLHDLADISGLARLAQNFLGDIPADASRYLLINNAGVVEPIGPTEQLDPIAIEDALTINLTATLVLSSQFLRATAHLAGQRRIINISSGAGRNPIGGWSTYCASKAGLDMFSRCVNIEQSQNSNPARVVSLAPGVIDTEMQSRVRLADKSEFADVERFRALKANGQLAQPDDVARRILALAKSDDFGHTEIDDLRNHANNN